jgi:hypothetical protein
LQFQLEGTVQKVGGKAAEELIFDGEVMFYAIMRGSLQVRFCWQMFPNIDCLGGLFGRLFLILIESYCIYQAMLETLPNTVSERAQFGKTLIGIDSCENGGIQVSFLDGTSAGLFDLVVGCDGIKSVVK